MDDLQVGDSEELAPVVHPVLGQVLMDKALGLQRVFHLCVHEDFELSWCGGAARKLIATIGRWAFGLANLVEAGHGIICHAVDEPVFHGLLSLC
ncbi:hypothetical protein D9M70_586980 [compost metagenome]